MPTFKKYLILFCVFTLGYPALCAEPMDTLYNQRYDWVSGQRESLPEWIFSPQVQGQVISVSDPCLKPEIARKQAIQRALYLYSFQQKAKVRLLSDYFSTVDKVSNGSDVMADKMLIMAVIQQPAQKYAYKILNEYASSFGELYLQVAVQPTIEETDESYLCQSISELMMMTTRELRENVEMKFQLNLETKKLQEISESQFMAKGNPERMIIDSYINGSKLSYPQQGCWYTPTLQTTPEECTTTVLKNSFWSAYIASFMQALLTYTYSDVNVKNVNENYGEAVDRDRSLSREAVVSNVSVIPSIQGISNDNLYINWQIIPVKQ